MTLGVEVSIERMFFCPRGIAWDDRLGVLFGDQLAKGIGIVGGVGDHDISSQAIDKRGGLRCIARLATGQNEANRTAQAAYGQMDFGRQAAARAPDCLIVSPPFAPLAC